MTGAGALVMDSEDAVPAGREAQFLAFVTSHRDRAVRLAWRLVGGDAGAAEDVAQDAFARAWRALPRFREEASLATWFYRILVNQAGNHRRWRGLRELWTPVIEADAPATETAGDPVVRRRIRQALDRLTRRQREAFVLVHLEEFTVREAAEILGTPSGTLKSHLHRALTKLRDDLSDLDTDPGDTR